MFHIAHQDAIALIIIPCDPRDFLLPPCRVDRKGNYFFHRYGRWSPRLDRAEMLHQPVEFIQSRSPVPTVAFGRDAKFFGHHHRVLDGLAVEWIPPCRVGNGEHSPKATQIVLHCLGLNFQSLGKRDDVNAGNLAAQHVGKVMGLDRSQDLFLGAPQARAWIQQCSGR